MTLVQTESQDAVESMSLLDQYYERVFPITEYGRWLSYGSDSYLTQREFSFTLQNDIYIRYQSYKTISEFHAALGRNITKIDVGAVYNIPPILRKSVMDASKLVPVEKEFVLDIDMSDYDDLRTCCSGANVCIKCWGFMRVAHRVLDLLLARDFGFLHVMFVFSGRRGIHGWVCDSSARTLRNDARSSLVRYLDFHKSRYSTNPVLPPSFQFIFESVLEPRFIDLCLVDQQLVSPTYNYKLVHICKHLLPTLPDHFVNRLISDWDGIHSHHMLDRSDPDTFESASSKWDVFLEHVDNWCKSKSVKLRELFFLRRNLIFHCMYPRLDANVSTHINHLLKSPFCMHPKTGKICVPIDSSVCDLFDPTTVPTVMDLISDLNSELVADKDQTVPAWSHTRLKPYMQYFTSFVSGIELEIRKQLRQETEASLEF